jgi:hypothetical protein
MAAPRAHCREIVVAKLAGDNAVAAVAGASVLVCNRGTAVPITQTIYADATSVATLVNPLASNATGVVEFWVPTEQTVDLIVSVPGFAPQTVTSECLVALESGSVNLNTSKALANTGDVFINGESFTWQGPSNSHTAVSLDQAQTVAGLKAFTNGISADGTHTLTLPAATDTLVGRATTDTLTNKTLTAATLNGGVTLGTPAYGQTSTGAVALTTIGPTFATSSTTMTNTNTWYTGATLGSALAAGGTYLLMCALSANTNVDDKVSIRLYDLTNSVEIVSGTFSPGSTWGCGSLVIPYFGYAGTPTIVVQANNATSSGQPIVATATNGATHMATFVAATRSG